MPNKSLKAIEDRFSSENSSLDALQEDSAVIGQTLKATFEANNDGATKVMRLMLASLQKGTFEMRNANSEDWEAPPPHYEAYNYMAHASRVMFDLSGLSQQYKEEFYQILASANMQGRTSTHNLTVDASGNLKEGKGFKIGLKGQLANLAQQESPHRGVNIAIGGEGNVNSAGKTITANGYSGHLFAYIPEYSSQQQSVDYCMLGLEQTAPHGMEQDTKIENAQDGADVYGNKHSLKGASDKCTALGSLYGSDPRFINAFAEVFNDLPPQKYNGMKVSIDDAEWLEIRFRMLQLAADDIESRFLAEPPKSASGYVPNTSRVDVPSDLAIYYEFQIDNLINHITTLVQAYHTAMDEMSDKTCTDYQVKQAKADALLRVVAALNDRDLDALNDESKKKYVLKGVVSQQTSKIISQARNLLEAELTRVQDLTTRPPMILPAVNMSEATTYQLEVAAVAKRIQSLYIEYCDLREQHPNHKGVIAKQTGLRQMMDALTLDDPKQTLDALLPLAANNAIVAGDKVHRCKDVLDDALKVVQLELAPKSQHKASM